MRSLVLLGFVVGCAAPLRAPMIASAVHVYESRADSAITEGDTVIAGDPDRAYAAAADYGRWTAMFPSIRQVAVTQHQGDDALVRLTRADGNFNDVHFHNQPARRTIWFENTHSKATTWAEIVFAPGDRPATTRVHSRLYADVHGVASIFVSKAKLRNLRQQRVASDLADLRSYFGRIVTAAPRETATVLPDRRGVGSAGSDPTFVLDAEP
jgi:hypothetical protein